MKLIVGLGNPGLLYKNSRHNVGFSVVKDLAKSLRISLKKERNIRSLSGRGRIGQEEVVLATPLTYMNLSGEAVSGLIRKYEAGLSELLVVCDDLDLEFGRLRLKISGSCAGHRGMRSIIEILGSDQFCRLRVGIGRPHSLCSNAAEFVLRRFNKKERIDLKEIIGRAVECCRAWAADGAVEAMNKFNKNKEKAQNE
jgi:PTH1 family peptidyl-tRNA hydrolase